MKRNLDLVRRVLLAIEESESEYGCSLPAIDSVTPSVVGYHVDMLIQAGLLTGQKLEFIGGPPEYDGLHLTWVGHEYLDAVRDKSVWAQIKGIAAEKGVPLTLDVARDLGIHLLKRAVGLD